MSGAGKPSLPVPNRSYPEILALEIFPAPLLVPNRSEFHSRVALTLAKAAQARLLPQQKTKLSAGQRRKPVPIQQLNIPPEQERAGWFASCSVEAPMARFPLSRSLGVPSK